MKSIRQGQPSPRSAFLILVLLVSAAILIALLGLRITKPTDFNKASLVVSFLDVGQGDAVLIQKPTGDLFNNLQVLIDGGPNRSVLSGLGELLPLFDRNIEVVIATHPDSDHIGGLIYVMGRYQVTTVIDNGEETDNEAYKSYRLLAEKSPHYLPDQRLRRLRLDPFTTITFLPVYPQFSDRNDNSIITRIDHGNTSWLLTGDASVEVEEYLIENYPTLLDVDILKLGHHGSRTSTSVDFLQATTPEYVVISAPLDSRYGHPHPEVLENLRHYGQARIFYTGSDGTIQFHSDFNNYQVKTTPTGW